MNANTDRAWREFLDVLTGRMPVDDNRRATAEYLVGRPQALWSRVAPDGPMNRGDNEFDDADNWRDGTMRDGMRRARREKL